MLGPASLDFINAVVFKHTPQFQEKKETLYTIGCLRLLKINFWEIPFMVFIYKEITF